MALGGSLETAVEWAAQSLHEAGAIHTPSPSSPGSRGARASTSSGRPSTTPARPSSPGRNTLSRVTSCSPPPTRTSTPATVTGWRWGCLRGRESTGATAWPTAAAAAHQTRAVAGRDRDRQPPVGADPRHQVGLRLRLRRRGRGRDLDRPVDSRRPGQARTLSRDAVAGPFIPAVGSSDSHSAGQTDGEAQTVVRSGTLSTSAIVRGIAAGHCWLPESSSVSTSPARRPSPTARSRAASGSGPAPPTRSTFASRSWGPQLPGPDHGTDGSPRWRRHRRCGHQGHRFLTFRRTDTST